MLADLDLLLTAVFCTADDLRPEREKNARRSLTDAEVATLSLGMSADFETAIAMGATHVRVGSALFGHRG